MGAETMDEAETQADTIFKPLTGPGPLNRDELQSGDDLQLWIVRVPPQMNVEELHNCKLPTSEGRVTRSDTAELTAEMFVPHGLHLLLPNKKGKKLKTVPIPVAGQVLVHQRLDVPPLDASAVAVTSLLPEPPHSRRDRHPLLGVGYKKTLKRNIQALALSDALDCSLASVSPKKKRKMSEAAVVNSTPNKSNRKKNKTPH